MIGHFSVSNLYRGRPGNRSQRPRGREAQRSFVPWSRCALPSAGPAGSRSHAMQGSHAMQTRSEPDSASSRRRHQLRRSCSLQTVHRRLAPCCVVHPSVCCLNLCGWRCGIQNGCCAVANPSARTQATFAFADDPPVHTSPQVWNTLRQAVRHALCSSPRFPSSSTPPHADALMQAVAEQLGRARC